MPAGDRGSPVLWRTSLAASLRPVLMFPATRGPICRRQLRTRWAWESTLVTTPLDDQKCRLKALYYPTIAQQDLHSPSMAVLTASSKSASLNGLYRNFTAP